MHIEEIKDFSRSDRPLLLLLGEAGSGKSELLQQVEEHLISIKSVRLNGKQHIKQRLMIQALSQQWQISVEDQGAPLVEQLRGLLNGLIRENRFGLLMIDDAHLLPYSLLAALIHIVMQQGTACHVHLLLSGRASLFDKVKTLYEDEFPVIRVGKLPEHEARQHIEDFLERSHISASQEAIDRIVARLYKDSGGIPSRIDTLLRELTLKDFMQPKAVKEKVPQAEISSDLDDLEVPRSRHIIFRQDRLLGEHGARGFAVFALLLSMGGLYWYEHHLPSVSPPMPDKPYHYPITQAMPLQQAVQPKLEPVPKSAVLAAAKIKPALAQKVDVSAPKARAKRQKTQPETHPVQVAKATSISPVNQSHVLEQHQLAMTMARTHTTHKSAPSTTYSAIPSRGGGYTVQLMGSFNRTDVEKQRQHLHLASSHIYSESFKHKPWYILGTGHYTTRRHAEAALHQLPASVRKQGAWVRRVSS